MRRDSDEFNIVKISNRDSRVEYIINGNIVASTILSKYFSKHEKIYNINSFHVNDSHRRQGYGQRLLEFIISYYGKYTLELGVKTDNIPAINLYKKFGFKTERTFEKDGIEFYRQLRN